MGVVEDLADELAKDVLKAADMAKDVDLYKKVSEIVGDSSTTLQDAYLTAVRVRIAERRARSYLNDYISKNLKNETPIADG